MAIQKSTPAVDGVHAFKLPDVGEGLIEAELLTWYVKPGDEVKDGQMICEIETAKAVVELPCPYSGTVKELFAAEGETVEVGTVIITVDDGTGGSGGGTAEADTGAETEEREKPLVGYGEKAASTQRRPRRRPAATAPTPAAPEPRPAPAPTPEPAAPAAPVRSEGRPLAKPPVRKLAKDLGIDLATVSPTGKDGIITRDDVHAAVEAVRAPEAVPAPETPVETDRSAREQRIPIKGVRKHTAAAMVNSAFTAPHVTEFLQVDVTRTVKAVRRLRQRPEFADVKVSPLLLVARALLMAVRRHPRINASWDEANQEIVVKHYVNLGIAAATERGLVVPNIKDADRLPLPDATVDHVLSSLALHHVPMDEKRRFAAELVRVLRPGGTVTVADLDAPGHGHDGEHGHGNHDHGHGHRGHRHGGHREIGANQHREDNADGGIQRLLTDAGLVDAREVGRATFMDTPVMWVQARRP